MKRMVCAALLCALALGALTGCGSLFDRSFSSVTPHQEQAASDEDASILRAETYADLVSCVQHFVSMGQSTGTVHVYNYTGDIESDLKEACGEVQTEDPLGAYALSGIRFEYSRIVSYYECTFDFTYRRSLEDMDSIVSTYGRGAIRDLIQEALSSFDSTLTIRTSDFYADRAGLYTLIQQAYYASPGTAMGYPGVFISIYPERGDVRIVEIKLTYPWDQETLQQRAEAAAATAAQLVGQDSAADETVAWLLYSRLLDQTSYSPEANASVYSALCLGSANSEGIALAYALLCQQAGIPCQLIRGTLDGTPHCWNLITLGETSWQLDLTRSDPEGFFLHNDAFMSSAAYNWSQEDYPPCEGTEPPQESIVDNEPADE